MTDKIGQEHSFEIKSHYKVCSVCGCWALSSGLDIIFKHPYPEHDMSTINHTRKFEQYDGPCDEELIRQVLTA